MKRETVVGVFDTTAQAQRAIEALKAAGFRGEDIGILMQNKENAQTLAADTGTKAGEGAAAGATTGGLLGGLAGLLVGRADALENMGVNKKRETKWLKPYLPLY